MEPDGTPQPHWAASLYDGCAAELVLYGRALGLSHAESEDVLHDTFRALLSLPSAPREPRFYVVRSFRNRALNHRRSLWRRLTRELQSSAWFEPGPGESPLERRAVEALRHLPPDQREVIVLKIWHGLTFDTIASLLGVNPNTAAGRYRYGLHKLRSALEADPHPDTADPHALPDAPFPGQASAPGEHGCPPAESCPPTGLDAALRQTVHRLQPHPAGGTWHLPSSPSLLP